MLFAVNCYAVILSIAFSGCLCGRRMPFFVGRDNVIVFAHVVHQGVVQVFALAVVHDKGGGPAALWRAQGAL